MYIHFKTMKFVYMCSTKTREYEIHQRKYSFWLQKVVKNNLNIISKKFRGDTIHITFSTNLYRVSLFCTTFSGNHEKKRKYRFKLQKRVKIQKILFLKTLEVDYITIPPLFLTTSHFGRIYSQKHIFL